MYKARMARKNQPVSADGLGGGTALQRECHARGKERKGLQTVVLGGVGAGPPAFLTGEPGARVVVVVALGARLGDAGADDGQESRD
jgi:hypothetical protein